jgi:glyoxylase-like metal-dependent hydrolase (beta-lactamase superfamily II)
MICETFPVGPLQANCTILGDEETHEAVVVDPGEDAGKIFQLLGKLGLTLKQILATHAHLDHIGGAFQLKKLSGAPVYLNENDLPLLATIGDQARWLGMREPETSSPDGNLTEGQIVGLEHFPAKVLLTPGHTQGSISLYLESAQLVIAGDTLFAGSIGRTDLPGGDFDQIIHSIQTQLFVLPDETRVITGHGPATSIGRERSSNPYVNME